MKNLNYLKRVALLFFLFGSSVFAHGVIESPASREQFCGVETKPDEIYKDKMTHEKCRPMMTLADGSMDNSIYNFMAVLTHTVGRSNKAISQLPANVCGFNSESWGGGKTPWDKAIDWPTVLISSGQQKFIWDISWGNHFGDTEEFVYWITKADFKFDPKKELSWNDFETTPFCTLKYNDQTPNANPNVIPDKGKNKFITLCNVPARQNRSVIYGEWGRNQWTYERFHSCIDVVFSNDTPPVNIAAVIKSLPTQIRGATEIELDGSGSQGANLVYNWSINADDLTPYKLTNSESAKAYLSIANIQAQQPVSVNLTITQGETRAQSSVEFIHLPAAVAASWQLVGNTTVTGSLKAGDKVQLRLIDSAGKDYFLPSEPLVLTNETAKLENLAFTLAQAINTENNFSVKMGVLAADNKTIEPVQSATENRIYVPVNSIINNGYIYIVPATNPIETCTVDRQKDSSSYWMGYNIFTDKAPFVLNFSTTGIDLSKIIISPGVFNSIEVLDNNRLLVNVKPDWVSKKTPGFMGFHPKSGSYEPLSRPIPASCQSNSTSSK